MASFGVRLRQEREKKSVSLDDISLSTKISTRMLRALEEERFDQLPGGIFNKGFIRAYARCVGLDEEQAVADYIAATSPPVPGKKSEVDQTPLPEPPPREPDAASLPWGMFAIVLLVVALAFVVWSYYSREPQKNSSTSATPTAAAPDSNETPPAEAPSSNDAAAPAITRTPIQPAAPSPDFGTPSQASVVSPPATPPNQTPPPRSTGLTLIIKAREDSWVSISIDGEVNTASTLTASTQRTVHASEEIVVRAGNAGALDFVFNGKKLPSQGEINQVKTLTFNARGLQSPTAKSEAPAP